MLNRSYCIMMLLMNLTACKMNQDVSESGDTVIREYNNYVSDFKNKKALEELQANSGQDIGFIIDYSITDDANAVPAISYDGWKTAPITGHSYENKNELHIQLGAGFFGGFAITIKKSGEQVTATYYEYADGEKVFRTDTTQPWKESINIEMESEIAVFTEVVEQKQKAVYARFVLKTLPFQRKDMQDMKLQRVNLALIIKCIPEQLPGNTRPNNK